MNSLDLLICTTCGVQHSTTDNLSSCKICDDPRQYIPASGQSWTTLTTLHSKKTHHNEFLPDKNHPNALITIHTVPRFAIGHRALLCRTPSGKNLLWDCLTYLDEESITHINSLGGIHAIVISHPHYFGAALHWADTFACPVYLAGEDAEWVMRRDKSELRLVFWEGREMVPLYDEPGMVVIKTGGHFPGSAVLWWRGLGGGKLLVADSIAVVPSGVYHVDRVPGTVSFTFMWSYPNMIPLSADQIHGIWKAIKHTEFEDAHGGFVGTDVRGNGKQKVLESAQIIVKAMGYPNHPILQEQ
ncbi:hypothetical protein ASPWEDRAFT_166474 [Aspergillus wentii DTO 134E9]|uniref:Metallo-beta-lactamase domain-containing protein n=1 Tax=Aspergillus wentii DTO 134E9 TaxID=1073089 RepID=A0A1L9RZT2_ASPWE|nr:uncharacterized protein ASPWEDRAFT_166474 [Aspergillus wentii DTO 134E9]KAI9932822.1 hypothetical protein MW887_009074 [Aspergillus wentii]OJJ40404.1 hypothetical protein ASPWEDRAFT_166474 [Aspergillus wentii DTO 134E9]